MPFRLLALFSLSLLASAKEPKVIISNWDQLQTALEGRKVAALVKPERRLTGTIANLDAKGLTLNRGNKGAITIARSEIQQLSASRKKPGSTGRIVGTAVGAGIGIAILAGALAYANNEGSDTVAAAGAAIAGLVTLAGYGIGSGFDHSTIRVEVPDLHK